MEIVSPGGLPAGMTEADLGFKSIPRNPLLFGMLHRMEAVEHIGSGIRRIRNLCRDYGVAEPQIDVSEHWFTVTFPRPGSRVESQQPESRPESRPELQPESLDIFVLRLLDKSTLSKSDISKCLGQKSVSGQLNKGHTATSVGWLHRVYYSRKACEPPSAIPYYNEWKKIIG